MLFYTIKKFHLASLGSFTSKVHPSTIYFNSGSKFAIVEGAGKYQILFREHKNYFGEHQENNSGSREKGVNLISKEAGDLPLQSLIYGAAMMPVQGLYWIEVGLPR